MTLATRAVTFGPLRLDGAGAPAPVASGYYLVQPTAPYDDGSGRVEILPFQISITGSPVTVDLPVTGPGWALKVTAYFPTITAQPLQTVEYVSIPTGSGTLQYENLDRVNPDTLTTIPATLPPAWQSLVNAANANASSALAATGRINVKDAAYGAVGNGSTSDVAAFTAAIAAAAAAKLRVFVPPGTYSLPTSTPLNIDPLLTGIDGIGVGTILDFSSSTSTYAFTVGSSSGSHEARVPFTNMNIVGPSASSTTVDGIKLGGTSIFADHTSCYDVRIKGFRHQVVHSSNSWCNSWFNCHFEAAQADDYMFDQSGVNLGEDIAFYNCQFYNNPQESFVIGPSIGVDVAFWGGSFDYSGRFIKQETGKVVCHGVHFEGDNGLVATGSHEMFLLTRSGSQNRPLLSIQDCIFLPFWTSRQATITMSGSNGDCILLVNNAYMTTGAPMTLPTFVQDTSAGAAAQIKITNMVYSSSINAPLYLDTTGSVSATAGRYQIASAGTVGTTHGGPVPFPQGITSNSNLTAAALTTPAAPTVTNAGTPGSTTYYYKLIACLAVGTVSSIVDTAPSTATSTTTGAATLNSTNYNIVTGSPVVGATSYKILKSTDNVTYNLLASALTSPTYNDQGASTSAYTATAVANPTGVITAGGLRMLPLGRNGNTKAGLGNPALYSDDGGRVFFTANGSSINILPSGDGTTAGALTLGIAVATLNPAIQTGLASPTYSASITIDARTGNWQTINATNGTAFTINAPSNAPDSTHTQDLTIEIVNGAGGALGTITWDAIFLRTGGAFTNPASGFGRFIRFGWRGSKWVEISRSAADYA